MHETSYSANYQTSYYIWRLRFSPQVPSHSISWSSHVPSRLPSGAKRALIKESLCMACMKNLKADRSHAVVSNSLGLNLLKPVVSDHTTDYGRCCSKTIKAKSLSSLFICPYVSLLFVRPVSPNLLFCSVPVPSDRKYLVTSK